MFRSLAVCIVVYHSDARWLTKTLTSLRTAINRAWEHALVDAVEVQLIDNAAGESAAAGNSRETTQLKSLIDSALRAGPGQGAINTAYIPMPTNNGFGAGNNAGLAETSAEFVLLLNPDVELAVDAISSALTHLDHDAACGAVTPIATSPDGTPQFLVKRDPTVFALALRGFAPGWLKARFARYLSHYDYSDLAYDAPIQGCAAVSGCWLLVRGSVWREVGGFDAGFFMYFEDFDLSQRVAKISRIDRLPGCRIVHAGGNASRKGARHIGMFVRSAVRYFGKHGWRWA
ncbi:MAG: glycosyltransferase [Rhodocyclaceae bacterium]|nr:glycosyltransferase [Rhodocyclaceae bacterium]